MKFLAFLFMLATFAIAAPVASSSSKHFRLSVQQAEHLKTKEYMIATHDMMAQVLLLHDHIDVNLKSRWLEDILIVVAKGRHFPNANGFVVDGRRNVGNLKRLLYSARNHCLRRAIESMMEHHNYHQYSLAPSPKGRFGGL
ncbi:unnamed protein product [Penicillium palitans]